ncbi:MAG: IPT/TIG domain-containing protein, partial [Thermoleophilia bacterium]|nr:IPT/TIG domain-containing protein [Thermoleophilia bacterium]
MAPFQAQATVLEPLTLEQLCQRATTIVMVESTDSTTRLGRLGGDGSALMPQTLVGFDVLEIVKEPVYGGAVRPLLGGPAPAALSHAELVVPTWGGTVGDLTVEAEGMPRFSRGETCILFLDAENRIIGGPQGKLVVRDGLVTGLRENDGSEMAAQSLGLVRTRIAQMLGVDLGAPATEYAAEPDAGAAAPMAEPALGETEAPSSLGASGTPVITGITPGSAPAGTGDKVVVTGSGFGSSAGSVDFYYKTGQTISGPIISWSDTAIVVEVPVGEVDDYWASAGSGPVTVTTAGGLTSAGYQFNVTFSYGQVRWLYSSVGFRVNPNCPDTSQERALIDAAAATWSAPTGFDFTDVGTCSTTSPIVDDGHNDLFWSSTILPSGVIGCAWTCYWA